MQRFGNLGMLFLLILLFISQMASMGQNKKNFIITGKITAEVQSNGNGVIEVAKTGGGVSKVDVPKNGRFRLELEYFNEFTLTFKVPGNFSKSIIISTDIPQDVWERDNDFPTFPMVVQLSKEIEGVDKSFTLKPTGKIFYSKQTDNFEKESLVSDAQLAEQVNNAKKQTGQVKKEEQIISKQEAQDMAFKQKSYDQTIGDADALFKKGEYLNAMLKYQDAKKLFPEKPYANDRIAEIQDLVKALENTGKQKAEKEQKYKDAIARADALFEKKSWQEAKPGYDEALQYKPADTYATGKINEIEKLIAAQGKQKQFDDLIVQADNNFKTKKLDQALTLYTQAKQLIPDNEYPQKQINLINQQKQELAKADQMENDYQALIVQSDKSLADKDYTNAQAGYQKAVALKPAESYPAGKLKEIEQLLQKEQQARQMEENYKSVIARADKSFKAKSYEEAKKTYNEALAIKPADAYPSEQIAKIDGILTNRAQQQQVENDFITMVGKGDAAFNIKDYEAARTSYTDALALKPNASEVKSKIKNIDDILQKVAVDKKKEEERQLALAREKEKAYNTAINQANKHVTDKRYAEAMDKYHEALQQMPDADYPKQQISRLEALLKQADTERKTDESYTAALKEAEMLFSSKNYTGARLSFVKAAELKPAEQLPTRRIMDIDKLLGEIALQQAKDKALEANYQEVVKRADAAFDAKEYASSRSIYGEASSLKPSEQYPKDKIARIDQLLAEAELQQYNNAITAADQAFKSDQLDEATAKYDLALSIKSNDLYAKKQLTEVAKRRTALLEEQNRLKKLEEQYAALMTDALNIFNNKEYEKAKEKYKQALGIKPQETLPKDQIAKIDLLLNELRNQEEINRMYTASMNTAENAFRQKKLKESRDAYQAALGYKPSEALPAQRIAEIDALIAKQENDAKLAAQAEADRLAKEKANKDQYDKAIMQGDQAFADKQYPQARTFYTDALGVFPSEKYPKDQISRIEELLAQQENDAKLAAQAEADRLAKEKANKDQYDKAIMQGDQAFADKQYPQARTFYTDALGVFPTEKYPKDQISRIEELLAQQENDAKLAAQAEADRLAKEKANKDQYDKAIMQGDQAFADKQYPQARTFYTDALGVFPSEKYPKDQISRIEELLAQQENDAKLAAQAEANRLAKEKANKDQYDKAIMQGDQAFADKQYPQARTFYTDALGVFPSEKYPKDQISRIEELLAQQENDAKLAAQAEADRLAKEKANKDQYDKAIMQGDQAFADRQYPQARTFYTDALGVFPTEKYPKDQISRIEELQAQQENDAKLAAQAEEEKKEPVTAIPDKQAPATPIADASALSFRTVANYDEAIKKADDAFGIKDYNVARFFYYKAIDLKPGEEYPVNQVELIRKLVDSQLSAIDRTGYDNIIKQADQAFDKKNYSVAKFHYYKALEIKSWEKYPKDRIHEILVLTNSLLSEKEEQEYNGYLAKADEALVVKDVSIARFYYNKAIAMKQNEEYPRIKLKDIQKMMVDEKQSLKDSEYNNLIELGDQAMQAENYSTARFNFTKALNMRPNEQYPKEQLKKIRELMNKTSK